MLVLVVDDSRVIRESLAGAVRDLGHEVLTAEDGERGWEMYRAHRPDAIVSDWMMPRLNGPDLCLRVRAYEGTGYTYFILVTVLAEGEHAETGINAGADDYLPKPVDVDELGRRLTVAERIVSLQREVATREMEQARTLAEQNAVLRLARRFAAEGKASELFAHVLAEAVELVGADDGGIALWLGDERGLVQAASHRPSATGRERLDLDRSASGLAATSRTPVVINDYQERFGAGTPAGRSGAQAGVAVPLLHEGRLLGTLSVYTLSEHKFDQGHAHLLELLAGLTSAELVGLERARLEGVLLMGRTAQHELNNKLGLLVGQVEALAADASLPEAARERASEIARAGREAADIVSELRRVSRIEEADWGPVVQPTLDLKRSTEG